jgi:hypothetical protein
LGEAGQSLVRFLRSVSGLAIQGLTLCPDRISGSTHSGPLRLNA